MPPVRSRKRAASRRCSSARRGGRGRASPSSPALRQKTGWPSTCALCSAIGPIGGRTIPSALVAAVPPTVADVRSGPGRRARRVAAIRERLRALYGVPAMEPHGDPLAELVLTVLSQSTNDRNRDVAFLRLRERFPRWDGGARRAGRGDRGGDPARRPARAEVARASRRSCDALPERPRPLAGCATRRSTRRATALCALPGVGRKTAACVLLFAYGAPRRPGRHARLARRHAAGAAAPRRAVRRAARRDARADAARRRARAARQPAAPRPAHLPRAHARRARACALRRMCPGRLA